MLGRYLAIVVLALFAGCAGAPADDTAYLKDPVSCASPVSFDEARHLLARTGFGVAGTAEIEALLPLCYEQAVNTILAGVRRAPRVPPPEMIISFGEKSKVKKMTAVERKAFNKAYRQEMTTLKHWWIREMLETDSPLTERLVVFWHGHFATEARKVKFGRMMYEQHAALRRNALGSFAELLSDVSKGAAMLFYLDGQKNVKRRPNENFAREVMELHSMGEGQGYSEEDVREGARAFTGWKVNRQTGKFRFAYKSHDGMKKTFLGKTGYFDGDDIIEIILELPGVARFITRKLWREFVSPHPDPAEVERLAANFRASGYRLGPLLKGLLMTPQFRDPANRGTLIKSPVELVIGTLRLFGFSEVPAKAVLGVHRRLGQDLFDPPDVNGWKGGDAWITTTTTLLRRQFLLTVLDGVNSAESKKKFGTAETAFLPAMVREQPEKLQQSLLAVDPVMTDSAKGKRWTLIDSLLLDPVYQLK